jgi:hypothetical protein
MKKPRFFRGAVGMEFIFLVGRRESNYLPIYKHLLRIKSKYFSGYPQKYPHIFKITALPFTTKKVKDLTPPFPFSLWSRVIIDQGSDRALWGILDGQMRCRGQTLTGTGM